MADRPLDRYPYYVQHFEHLDRVLSRPQLAGMYLQQPLDVESTNFSVQLPGIGISGCIGSVSVLTTQQM